MNGSRTSESPRSRRLITAAAAEATLVVLVLLQVHDPVLVRVMLLTGTALILWLGEVIPPFATTLALIAAIPLALGGFSPGYHLTSVLGWNADPVLALFLGGFALGAAASRHGIDVFMAERALGLSRHRRRRLVALVMMTTAVLSMWMSNIAAAAMMLAALRPHLLRGERGEPFRRALLLAVAMAANLGGMATPIGTGPNGIAIAALESWRRITFVDWMAFALPLMIGMVVLSGVLIVATYRVAGGFQPMDVRGATLSPRARGLVVVFALAVAAWLSEPLHGVAAPIVSLAATAILFAGGWLSREDLGRIDWSTLLLIAGGLTVGRLIEHSGLITSLAGGMDAGAAPLAVRVTGFVLVAALMGAVMSNTASAALLIPIALGIGLPRETAVLIAIGTSFGVPFTISSPPNAMAYGEGGLEARDLLAVGLPLMIVGSLIVGLTGPAFLRWIGLH